MSNEAGNAVTQQMSLADQLRDIAHIIENRYRSPYSDVEPMQSEAGAPIDRPMIDPATGLPIVFSRQATVLNEAPVPDEAPLHPTSDSNVITVSPLGESHRDVYFNRKTGIVTAGCFRGDVESFRQKIREDYGGRLRSTLETQDDILAVMIARYRVEYLATADYFEHLLTANG